MIKGNSSLPELALDFYHKCVIVGRVVHRDLTKLHRCKYKHSLNVMRETTHTLLLISRSSVILRNSWPRCAPVWAPSIKRNATRCDLKIKESFLSRIMKCAVSAMKLSRFWSLQRSVVWDMRPREFWQTRQHCNTWNLSCHTFRSSLILQYSVRNSLRIISVSFVRCGRFLSCILPSPRYKSSSRNSGHSTTLKDWYSESIKSQVRVSWVKMIYLIINSYPLHEKIAEHLRREW